MRKLWSCLVGLVERSETMRSTIVIAAIVSLAAGTAFAQYGNQTAAPGAPRPSTQLEPATPPANPATPSNAARSPLPQSGPALTETQAKTRIEAQGFTGVTQLKEDGQGAWN